MSHDSHKRRASDEEDEEDKQPHKKHATTRVDSEASAHMNSMSAMDDEKPIGEEDTLPSSSSSSAAAASSSSAATALPPAVDFSLVHTEQLRQWAEPLLGAELFSVPDLFLLPPSVLLYIRASAVDDVPVMHVYVIKCMGLHQTLFDDLLSSDGPPITPKYREHALWEQICMAIDREVTTVDRSETSSPLRTRSRMSKSSYQSYLCCIVLMFLCSVSVEMISSSSSSSSIVQLKSSSSPVWANVVVLLLRASEGGVSTQRACYTPPADGDIRPLLNAFRRMILDEQNDLGFWSYLHGAELELANASGSVPAIPSLDEAAALSASTASSSTRRELRSELAPCEADCLFQHLTMHASPMQQVEQFFAKFRLEMDPCFRGQWRRHIMRALQEQHGDGAAAAAGGAGAASSSSSSATIAPVARHQFQVDPSVLSVIFQLNSPLASLLVPHVLASSLFSPLDQVEGNTALHLAAAARDVAAVRALLQYGAFEIINLPNARRQTPLHCMMLGHTSRQQQLMQAHSLTLAPRERDLRHLLQAKADVNAASGQGNDRHPIAEAIV